MWGQKVTSGGKYGLYVTAVREAQMVSCLKADAFEGDVDGGSEILGGELPPLQRELPKNLNHVLLECRPEVFDGAVLAGAAGCEDGNESKLVVPVQGTIRTMRAMTKGKYNNNISGNNLLV